MPFLIIMVSGLIGLLLMALPGFMQHGHSGTPHIAPPTHGGLHIGGAHGAHGAGHALPGAHTGGAVHGHAPGQAPVGVTGAIEPPGFELTRLIPSPRAVFSILALFGAFGYALLPLVHWWPVAAALAVVPACSIEYFAMRPLWNLMFKFQGLPDQPMEALVTCEATAVTPFRNGKGLVSVEHNGRVVQFSARLSKEQGNVPVNVGDTLCVEEVDSGAQRVLVSLK